MLLENHQFLDATLQTRLESLVETYAGITSQSDKQLKELESRFKPLFSGIDTHLEQTLVRDLAGGLRQAANTFSGSLTSLEDEFLNIVKGVTGLHESFHNNLEKAVVPAVRDISHSLHLVASALGIFA